MRNIIILISLVIAFHLSSAKLTTTMKISERIMLLKKQIRQSLRNPSRHQEREQIPAYYESDENAPIKPILEKDELKKDDRYRLKRTRTTTTSTTTTAFVRALPKILRNKNASVAKLFKKMQNMFQRYKLNGRTTAFPNALTHTTKEPTTKLSLSIFYRRQFDKGILENTQEWTHCSEHITPYLKGVKKELTRPAKVVGEDHIAHRLINLLKANATKMTRSEKKTTMYQISKLRIRLYSWDLSAVDILVSVIAKLHGRSLKVDFASLKAGLLNMLRGWQADLSNATTMVYQAKVFRPVCLPRGPQGSSKFVRGSTLSTTTPLPLLEQCRRDINGICME